MPSGPSKGSRELSRAWYRLRVAHEFETPARARQEAVVRILKDGRAELHRLALEDDVEAEKIEFLTDLFRRLPEAMTNNEAFDSWCDGDLVWAMEECSGGLKSVLWDWKQLVSSIREEPPF